MRKRREINVFSISFLDLLSGALGAVIILYVAIPKNKTNAEMIQDPVKEILQQELISTKDELRKTKEDLAAAVAKLDTVKTTPMAQTSGQGTDLDIGFKFKGKNIVFLIDTSYSMIEEDRMGQVKAGIKMLITALPDNYQLDVVQFPLGQRIPFKSMWGTTKKTNAANKMDAFDFIYRLRPLGGTPTREALLFVLRNYSGISDIVLLSDGAPTLHNSNKRDDIFDILRVVREENAGADIQINTIGVGSDFIKDQTSERYKFLSLLASDSGGFFVGF